eukprot:m.259780 g.259780  ORF g.259780 m.259780 type:complete len:248 (-) comp38674_c0_seq1:361-1104(-)
MSTSSTSKSVIFAALVAIVSVSECVSHAPIVKLTHYSDAQCPCSARVPSDMFEHFLGNTSGFDGLVDFQQFFVGDLTKNVAKCIHGEEECVAQRFFACAQNMSGALPYSQSGKWLEFEACAYGACTDCAAIEGEHCPCYNYTVFPEFQKNDILRECAARVGFDGDKLFACGTGPLGQQLMEASSTISNKDGITYGVDGLAPIYLDGVKIPTKNPIPIVCGPVPKEVKAAVCLKLKSLQLNPPACVAM